jgi:ectonucleotide pyrophosphatase/phosphodiesterase family protein 7
MGGIFIASGPSFQSGVNIGVVEAVHLYELMCNVLGILPAENDGRFDVWDGVLN